MFCSRIVCVFLFCCIGAKNLQGQSSLKDSLQNLVDKQVSLRDKANELHNVVYLAQKGGPELSIYFAKQLLNIADSLDRDDMRMNAFNMLGSFYSYSGKMDSSIFYFTDLVRVSRSLGDRKFVVLGLGNLAIAYFELNDYANTLELADSVMIYAKEINDTTQLAKINALYAGVFIKQNEYEKALKFARIAYEYNLAVQDTLSMVTSLNAMAISHRNLKNYPEAVRFYKESIRLNEAHSHTLTGALVDAYHNLGDLYISSKNYDRARRYVRKSLTLSGKYDLVHGKTSAYSTLSKIALYDNKPSLAIIYGDSALVFLEQRDQLDRRMETLQFKSEAYAKLGMYKEAYQTHVDFHELYDSLEKILRQKEVQKLQTAFETEQKVKEKEQQIELLEVENELNENRAIFLIAALVLAALAVLALFNRFMVKRKSERRLAEAYADISQQKELVEKKNEKIEDSIRYAKRIQMAILPSQTRLNEIFPEAAVCYKAKDIVSGDFYWTTKKRGERMLAAVDCTGHGVPGAFMSVMGYDLLNEIVNGAGVTDPGKILAELDVKVFDALHKQSNSDQTDGMDAAICAWQPETGVLRYAGAHRPLYRLAGDKIEIIRGDKRSIGNGSAEPFTTHEIRPAPGELFFMFSDGVTDQFGGPKGRKFSPKRLQDALLKYRELPVRDLAARLDEEFASWSEGHAQIDDIMLVAFAPQPTG